jgi:hypothetical protein
VFRGSRELLMDSPGPLERNFHTQSPMRVKRTRKV